MTESRAQNRAVVRLVTVRSVGGGAEPTEGE